MFLTCSNKDLQRIYAKSAEKTFKAGETILDEGDAALEAYVLLKGVVEIRKKNKKIATAGAGNIVGELALLDDGPRTAKVVCVTDCEPL